MPTQKFDDYTNCHNSLPYCHCKCPYCDERNECVLFDAVTGG